MEQMIGTAGTADLIKDTGAATFGQDVIEASMQNPVIVQFWAPWCGPCKQLMPVVEQAVSAAGGKVKMVKVNIDEEQQIAAQMRVQSVPAVFGFVEGRPVDGFVGAQPPSKVQEFVQKLIQAAGADPLADALAQAKEVAKSDPGMAMQIYAQVQQHQPDNTEALAGMAQLYLDAGQFDETEAMLSQLPPHLLEDASFDGVKAAIALQKELAQYGDPSTLAGIIEQQPDNHEARFNYAMALAGQGQREDAVTQLAEIIRRDREWNDDAARKQMLDFFNAWGQTDPATIRGRRKLSAVLFS